MPTGYTADIAKGITFKEYALSCARAFGALILMRDEPADAPIPERFEPSTYHADHIKEIEAELEHVQNMISNEADKAAEADCRERLAEKLKAINAANELRAKYAAMLRQVRAWVPPSQDHVKYKQFMIDQIEKSIDFDCSTEYYEKQVIRRQSAQEWQDERLNKLMRELAYHQREHAKEIERTEERNRWIKQLRKSLAEQ